MKYLLLILVLVIYYKSQKENMTTSSDSLFSNICTLALILLVMLLYIGFQQGQPLTLKKDVVN